LKFVAAILLLIAVVSVHLPGFSQGKAITVDIFGDKIETVFDLSSIGLPISSLSDSTLQSFYTRLDSSKYKPVVNSLLTYKNQHQLDDWLYYQLIRSTAECISPKAANYQRYTLFKWFLLVKSGYATTISIRDDRLLLYIQSDDQVFNIPYRVQEGKQYVCLNYHDYGLINFEKEKFIPVRISIPEAQRGFSYQVTKLPNFKTEHYSVKELKFEYYQTSYFFKVLLNSQIKKIFNNYPVVDYATYFNIPLSNPTYHSLVPLLKKNIGKMSNKDGVDYLMRFTRYAFTYEADTKNYGQEKRLSPEQTLLYDNSDCEDRAALFFYLVKEIYNLPMIVLSYPEHITIAVQFDKLSGSPIVYNGKNYWVCEPTPQKKDLRIGESLPSLRRIPYEIVYAYNPEAETTRK
jgi:hypothetical protein